MPKKLPIEVKSKEIVQTLKDDCDVLTKFVMELRDSIEYRDDAFRVADQYGSIRCMFDDVFISMENLVMIAEELISREDFEEWYY